VNIALLDVNVLLALLWPSHTFHVLVRPWFERNRAFGWATCPITEAGFVRVFSQPAIVNFTVSVRAAMDLLVLNCREPDHFFWPNEQALSDLLPEIQKRLVGHQQLTNAILVDLAIRRGGRFVTLDRRVTNLLPPDSLHLSRLVVISQE
jgi:hypothetical protein